MKPPDPDHVSNALLFAIMTYEANRPRSQQSASGVAGISDVGTCHEYTRLLLSGQPQTDEPEKWTAFIGEWLGEGIETAVQWMWPNMVQRHREIVVTLPSGLQLAGHPDLVYVDPENGVLDIKTVDMLAGVRKTGPSEQQQFQRHMYAAGLIQDGTLTKDCWVGNAWFDRSGSEARPYVDIESYDPTWLERADEWMSDVRYAIENNEEAMKDKPIEWCEKCCEFYSVCRGEDARKDREMGGLITDPEKLTAVEILVQAREDAREIERRKEYARRTLADVSGSTGTHMVRWVNIGESQMPGYTRNAYQKLDVRPLPTPKEKKDE